MSGTDLLSPVSDDRAFFGEVSQKEFGNDIELISVVLGNWKLIMNLKRKAYELYQIGSDPDEKVNVIDGHPEIASKLKLKLQKWLKHVRKPGAGPGRKKKTLTESEREKLKTLGYIN